MALREANQDFRPGSVYRLSFSATSIKFLALYFQNSKSVLTFAASIQLIKKIAMEHSSFAYNLLEQFSEICKHHNCPLSKKQKLLLYSFLSQYYYHLFTKGFPPSLSETESRVNRDFPLYPTDYLE